MARTENCLLPTIVKVLLPKLQMVWHEEKQQRLCNLPQSYIFCSKGLSLVGIIGNAKKQQESLKWQLELDNGRIHASMGYEGN